MSFCGCKEGFLFESRSGSCYREFSPASCPPGTTWRRRLSGVSTLPSSIAPVLTCLLPAGHNLEEAALRGKTLPSSIAPVLTCLLPAGHNMEKAALRVSTRGKHLSEFHCTCYHTLLACWAQHRGGCSTDKHLAQFHCACSHLPLARWTQHGGGSSLGQAPCPVQLHLLTSTSCLLGTTWRRLLYGISTLPSFIAPALTFLLLAGHNMEEAALWGKHLAQFNCTC